MSAVPRPLAAYLVLGFVALCWSAGWVVQKVAVTAVPPLEFAAVRFAGASLVLLLALAVTRTAPARRPAGALALSGLLGYCVYNALALLGLTMAPASDAALIVPTTLPALTAAAAMLVGERQTRGNIVGIAVASLGAVLVVAGGAQMSGEYPQRVQGDLLLLAASVCWAIYTVLGTVTLRHASALAVVTTSTVIGALLLFPLGFLERGYADLGSWSVGTWLAQGYVTVIQGVVSFVVFFWAVGRYGAGLASMTSYLTPLGALLLAMVALGERPAPLQWVGGAVILVGVRFATRGGARARTAGEVKVAASEAL